MERPLATQKVDATSQRVLWPHEKFLKSPANAKIVDGSLQSPAAAQKVDDKSLSSTKS